MPSEASGATRWAAGATLAGVMSGHVLLETGVDALFLANVDIARLPIVTIVIAFLALAVSRLDAGQSHRRALGTLQLIAGAGTFGFWLLIGPGFEWLYSVLYVWSGVVTSLVVVRFWLLLGELFTISQGKRAFASIAMGGSIGALLGSGLAALLAPSMGGQGLLLFASLALSASALGPALALAPDGGSEPRRRDVPDFGDGWRDSIRSLLGSPYARRVAALVMIGGMTLTLGDFLFKSVLTQEVSGDALAIWLSRIYLGLNLLSIAVLAFGTTPIVRRLGVDRSLAVLPSLIGIAAIGVLLGGALGATIFLKLVDGTLRYSLHKTASELLYLPMTSALRRSVKTAIDLVGQSGAKALASLLVLCLVVLPDSTMLVAAAVAVFALVWVGLVLRLRRSYLDVFRETLGEGTIQTVLDHPELDLESAGSLVRALSDPDERRAMAAILILVERGKRDLIPNLILYHPSPRVVVQALDLFSAWGRDDFHHLMNHLIDHPDSRVRAATVRAAWVLNEDIALLRRYQGSECLVVRVSAYAGLLSAGETTPERFQRVLEEALEYELPDARLAASMAARLRYDPVYREALVRMANDPDLEVAQEAVSAIRGSRDEWFIPRLVDLLGHRGIREGVRSALIAWGRPALDELSARLGCERTSNSIQTQIPRTIARFDDPAAVGLLLAGLARVENGLVRFRLLRGLETLLLSWERDGVLNASHRAVVDLGPLRAEFERTLERTVGLLNLERGLKAGQLGDARFSTVAGALLVDLLRDKRTLATGRLFMMLGLLHPKEDFRVIRSGLISEDPTDRASAQELIETLLDRELGNALLSLVSGGQRRSSRKFAGALARMDARGYASLLQSVLDDDSETLRAVALYHAGELELQSVTEPSVDRVSEDVRVVSSSRYAIGWRGKERGLAAIRELFERRSGSKPAVAS